MSKGKTILKHLLAVLITLVIGAVSFYFTLPAINAHSVEFWFALVAFGIIFAITDLLLCGNLKKVVRQGKNGSMKLKPFGHIAVAVPTVFVLAAAVVIALGSLSSLTIFQSKNLSKMITVESADIAEYNVTLEEVPLMDKATATLLSQRKMGGLTDLVSQFSVGTNAQINLDGEPVRVAPLRYNGFFKWFGNRNEGIVGYITIDMVSQQTELVRVENGIHYSDSAYFSDNLSRHLRFAAPTRILGESVFELDENHHPYWVTPYYRFKAGWFGGKDVAGVLITDAVTGTVSDHKVGEIPDWVDHVYPADLILEQYDYYGAYQNGYWNSIIEQIGVVQTTEGYNYIAIDTDIYVYSGVTSIADDESNIGFIFVNQRTKETVQYTVAGAEEYSAMASAEGQVQHLNYNATFPLLINLNGEPTYYMALKDAAGLVKMYGLVNVEKYQYVAVESTLEECIKQYTDLLGIEDANIDSTQAVTVSGKITELRTAMVDGTTWYYLLLDDGSVYYKASVADFEQLILADVGDRVQITYVPADAAFVPVLELTLR